MDEEVQRNSRRGLAEPTRPGLLPLQATREGPWILGNLGPIGGRCYRVGTTDSGHMVGTGARVSKGWRRLRASRVSSSELSRAWVNAPS